MGIEQIILPLLGGVATGMTHGFEAQRKQKAEQQEMKDQALIQLLKDPTAWQIPEVAAGAERLYGKNEARAYAKAIRMKNAYDAYRGPEILQGNVPMSQGEFQAQQGPETQIPGLPPNTPGTAVDITGQSGGGGGNPLMGLLGKILPAIGGQAAGGSLQGAPQLPPTPQAQSNGPPSGPQGYQQQQPGGGGLPESTGKIIGYLGSGRPVVQNVDGSTSTHRNMTAGFDGKFYIVPTMYGGRVYPPDQAAQIIRQNKMVDPDTGQALKAYATEEEAAQDEQRLHGELEKEVMTPIGAPVGTPQGTPTQPRVLVESPGKAAFSGKKKIKLAPGTSLSQNVPGFGRVTITGQEPSYLKDPKMAFAAAVLQAGGKIEGDLTEGQNLWKIYQLKEDLDVAVTGRRAAAGAEGKFSVEGRADVIASKARAAQEIKDAQNASDYAWESNSSVQQSKANQARLTAKETEVGKAEGGMTPIPGGGGLTPNQQEVKQAADKAREVTLAKPLEAIEQDRYQRHKKLFTLGEQAQQIYKQVGSEVIHPFWATQNSTEWRKYWGTLTPGEQRLHSVIQDIYNEAIKDLSGAGVPVAEAPRLIGPLPNMAVGDPALFVDELQRFMANAEDAVNTQVMLARTPRGELQGVGKSAPSLAGQRSQQLPAPPTPPPARLAVPTQPPGRREPVAPHNAAATAPPGGGPAKEFQVNQASVATPALRTEMQKRIAEMKKKGEIAPDAQIVIVPDVPPEDLGFTEQGRRP